MLSARSTHKRKRSAKRGDDARDQKASGRAIVTVAGSGGKDRSGDTWAWKRLRRDLVAHPLNHRLQLLFPLASDNAPSEQELASTLDRLVAPGTAYLASMPIALLLDPIFVSAYIKNGSLIALSGGRLDTDDVFCLDGRGMLHLSLTRDTYQSLGLVGRQSKLAHTSSGRAGDRRSGGVERWSVRIDLLSPSFVPGKPGYERTLARLRSWDASRSAQGSHAASFDAAGGLGFASGSSSSSMAMLGTGDGTDDSRPSWRVLLYHSANSPTAEDERGEHGCEITLPARFAATCTLKPIHLDARRTTMEDVWLPDLSTSKLRQGWREEKGKGKQAQEHGQQDDWLDWIEELQELTAWTTLAASGAECTRTFSRAEYANGYQVAEPRTAARVLLVEYVGFFSAGFVKDIVDVVGHWASTALRRNVGWAHVRCTGFEDAPVAWTPPLPIKRASPRLDMAEMGEEEEEEKEEWKAQRTGKTARRARSKKVARRSHITTQDLNEHARGPELHGGSNGWELFLFGQRGRRGGTPHEEESSGADYIYVEDVSSVLRS